MSSLELPPAEFWLTFHRDSQFVQLTTPDSSCQYLFPSWERVVAFRQLLQVAGQVSLDEIHSLIKANQGTIWCIDLYLDGSDTEP